MANVIDEQSVPDGVVDLSAWRRLHWVEAVLPDSSVPAGSPPPEMVVLGRGGRDGRALWVLVRFPVGWARPAAGWYAAEEQVVLLEGQLSVSGVAVAAPGWVCFPPRIRRFASASRDGALALARFSESPRWVRGDSPEPSSRAPRTGSLTGPAPGGAVALLDDAKARLWLVRTCEHGLQGSELGAVEAVLSLGRPWFGLGRGGQSLLAEPSLAPWLCWAR